MSDLTPEQFARQMATQMADREASLIKLKRRAAELPKTIREKRQKVLDCRQDAIEALALKE